MSSSSPSDPSAPRSQPAESHLFEPAPQARPSAVTVLLFVITSILVFGGFHVMSLAFTFEEWGIPLFSAGILLDALGLWIVFGVIPARDRR